MMKSTIQDKYAPFPPIKRKLQFLALQGFAALAMMLAQAEAAIMIFPGTMYLNPAVVSHGQEYATNRWALDALGGIATTTAGASVISFDYSATPTLYGNWSIGGPAQGASNIFTFPFTAGNLANVVDENGAAVTLVNGSLYRLSYQIKPTEFSYGSGLGTWAIGHGDTYNVSWSYNGNTANSSVVTSVDSWQTVSFDFTYVTGNDFVLINQNLNGGAPSVTRLTGSGGPTPGANLDAPTIQFAGASPIPEPSVALMGSIATLLLMRRRRMTEAN